MTLVPTVIGLVLFGVALVAQFLSDAATDKRRKIVWRRVMQVTYLALLVFLVIEFYPVVSKMLMA